jgi:hypothetical protein
MESYLQERRNFYKILDETFQGKKLRKQSRWWKIKLKWNLNKQDVRRKYGNGHLSYVKYGENLVQLKIYQVLRKDFFPMELS